MKNVRIDHELARWRIEQVNNLIRVIAELGPLLHHGGETAWLEMGDQQRVLFHDYFSGNLIDTHRLGTWRGFTSGGTMRCLVERFRDFVCTGSMLGVGVFDAKLWAYSDEAIVKIRETAIELGIAKGATT